MACIAMIGAGAAAGSLIGVETNAALTDETARMVAVDSAPVVTVPRTSRAASSASVPSIASTSMPEPPAQSSHAPVIRVAANSATGRDREAAQAPAAADPAATDVIAMRFPAQWHPAASQQGAPPRQAMAYAAEPAAHASAPSAGSESGYRLASVDPAPPLPRKRVARTTPKEPPLLFNDAQIASIKQRLQLTPQQEQYWPAVASALRAISWRHAAQAGRKKVRGAPVATIDPNSPEVQRLKSAAFPLIMTFSEAQKSEVRQLAHTMGLRQVAAMF